MQANHNRKGPSTEDRRKGSGKSCYCCEATPSHLKKYPTRDAEQYKCGKKGHSKGNCRLKKEQRKVGRTKDMTRKQRPMKVHELKVQATAVT